MVKKYLLLVLAVLFGTAWNNAPGDFTPVCTAEGSRFQPRLAADGYGGAVFAWEDNRNGNRDIYAQLLDANGEAEWNANGIPICTAIKRQKNIDIIPDGANGAIIAWQDKRSGSYDIYAQRVDHSGTTQWAKDGVPVCTAAGEQESPKIISDGAGGAIIAWQDGQIPGTVSIIAQRIDSSGNLLWATGGEIIFNYDCEYDLWEENFDMVSDEYGGAIIISKDAFRAQRLNAAGTFLWQAGGVPIAGNEVAADGLGGVFIGGIGTESMGGYYRYCVYVQRFDSGGTKLWAGESIRAGCSSYSHHECLYGLRMIADTQGGCILTYIHNWECYGCGIWGNNVCVTRVDSTGAVNWEAGFTTTGRNPRLVPDGSGGAICTWQDYRDDESGIYAQHITAAGEYRWVPNAGVYVSTIFEDHRTVSDGAGGCIVTWGHADNIYAQNVCGSGSLGDCDRPVAVIDADRFGGIAPVTIHFDGSDSFDPDGTVTRWEWDLGDGNSSSKEKFSYTFYNPGTYNVVLRVKDNSGNWSARTQKQAMIFSMGDIDRVEIEVNPAQVKASGKGRVQVRAACFAKYTTARLLKEKPVPVDIGLDFTTTSGTWPNEVSFSSGVYSRTLISGKPGTADISAVIDGEVFKSESVEFTWPKPPVNLHVELKENRSLFMGEYDAYLSWSENPDELFTPAKYRVYRSTNGGAFELIHEVDANVFTYVDASLPAGSEYRFAVSLVDSEGDESPAAQGADKGD